MPHYVHNQLIRYKHPKPMKPQGCPIMPTLWQYGSASQELTQIDDSPLLPTAKGTLYSKPLAASFTVDTNHTACTHQFLNYMASNTNAIIHFHPSDMVTNTELDTSCFITPCAHSRAAEYYIFGSIHVDYQSIWLNGAICILCTIYKFVASSATEAKLGALFLNEQEALT